jgi:hypothetical protein
MRTDNRNANRAVAGSACEAAVNKAVRMSYLIALAPGPVTLLPGQALVCRVVVIVTAAL